MGAIAAAVLATGGAARADGDPADPGLPGFVATPSFAAISGTDTTAVNTSAVGNFDGDGHPDLVTVQRSGTLNLLLNDGTGNLAVTYSNQSGCAFSPDVAYIEVADLNADGFDDVVAADVANSAFLVFLNEGDGTFARATSVSVSPESGAAFYHGGGSLTVGDVNADGFPDVVTVSPVYFGTIASGSTTFSQQTFLGNGDGTFQTPAASNDRELAGTFVLPWGQSLALADLNGDRALDLVMRYDAYLTHTAYVTSSLGAADGTFHQVKRTVEVSPAAILPGLALSDLDGDGVPDLSFVVGDGNAYVALGNGDGTFRDPDAVLENLRQVALIAVADFDADGRADLLAYGSGFNALYAGIGDGTFDPYAIGQDGGDVGGSQEPKPADFDGDGNLDYVLVDPIYARALLYRGLGNGDFRAQRAVVDSGASQTLPNATLSARSYAVIATGDLDGDGVADVLAMDDTERVVQGGLPSYDVGLNDGHAGFDFRTAVKGSDLEAVGATQPLPVLADFDHDGTADLVFVGSDYMGIALGRADGTYAALKRIPLPVATSDCQYDYQVAVGDLDHDGNLDMVVPYQGNSPACIGARTSSGYLVFLGDGEGGFAASYVRYGESVHEAKLVDLDGDGNLDLVVADGWQTKMFIANSPTTVTVLPGKGDGTFDSLHPRTALDTWKTSGIVLGDYDGDGKQDLTLLSWAQIGSQGPVDGTKGILLLKGHGDLTFDEPVLVARRSFATQAEYADFDGDGRPDLAFVSNVYYQDTPTYFGLQIVPNLGNGEFGEPIGLPSPAADYATMVGDFDGDGAPDVLVAPDHGFLGGVNQMASALFLNRGPTAPDFALTATPQALDLAAGQSGTVSLELVANATFDGNVTVACSGLPDGASCAFSPETMTLMGGQSRTMSVVLSSGDGAVALAARPRGKSVWLAMVGLALLPGMILAFPTRRRRALGAAGTTLVLMLAFLLVHCGGAQAAEPTQAQVTLTATGVSGATTVVQTAVVSVRIHR